jgi:hypothetical protein
MPAEDPISFFRIKAKEEIGWDGESFDANPDGIHVRKVRKPEIDIQYKADEPIPQGTVRFEYMDAFKIAVMQDSIFQALAGLVPQIALVPQVFAGGGVDAVARHIQHEVNQRIRPVTVSLTTHSSTPVYRKLPEDGREPMYVRAVAQTHGEVVIQEAGVTVTLKTDVEAPNSFDLPIPQKDTPISTQGTSHIMVQDGQLIRLLAGGSSRVTVTVSLVAHIDAVMPPGDAAKWLQAIADQLRAKLKPDTNDEVKPPAGADPQGWREWSAKLVDVLNEVLQKLAQSLAQRIVASSVSATTLELARFAGALPAGAAEQWAVHIGGSEQPAESAVAMVVVMEGQQAFVALRDRLLSGSLGDLAELLKLPAGTRQPAETANASRLAAPTE